MVEGLDSSSPRVTRAEGLFVAIQVGIWLPHFPTQLALGMYVIRDIVRSAHLKRNIPTTTFFNKYALFHEMGF